MKGLEVRIGDRTLKCALEYGNVHVLVSNNSVDSEWMATGINLGIQPVSWGGDRLSEEEKIKVKIVDLEGKESMDPVQRKAIDKESILGEMERIKKLLTTNGFEL